MAANINIWMIYINEESPQGKNALWSNFILIIGITGQALFYLIRPFFIINDKSFTILHWKGLLFFSVIIGTIVTIILIFTIKETAAYDFKFKLRDGQNSKKIEESLSFNKSAKIIFKGARKRSYLFLLMISVLFSIAVGSGNLLEPYMMNYSLVSSEEFSLISMVGLIGLVFFYLLTGKIADRFGRRILIIVYSFLYPISVILQFAWGVHISSSYIRLPIMFVLKILGMSTRAGLWSLFVIISIEIIPTEVRGVGNGIQTLIMNITGLSLGIITAPLFQILGIQLIALILTCFMFPIIPIVIYFIPESLGLNLKTVK